MNPVFPLPLFVQSAAFPREISRNELWASRTRETARERERVREREASTLKDYATNQQSVVSSAAPLAPSAAGLNQNSRHRTLRNTLDRSGQDVTLLSHLSFERIEHPNPSITTFTFFAICKGLRLTSQCVCCGILRKNSICNNTRRGYGLQQD